MRSVILQTITRLLLAWMLVFSWWVLLRGHNAPGGGFIGGLIAASAFSLYLLAYGVNRVQQIIYFSPVTWLGFGLILMLLSSISGLVAGKVFMSFTALRGFEHFINSAITFDVGVYLVVCFSVLCILIALERSQ
ncbi:MnhB domain-containing protein [Legionella londiniensis]|uniref:Na(+)/H(+) antiporter subunit B n=1 Tax=Legionella londiniensis TaxID=45068 RepID=A0A0W0VSJ0_9GAMM|nr:MnhB domain-containing protein [Legionella londiniensis]KTD23204.1 Na(+)/H(+) antiporter subunit B [Legionella londiniensis]STX93785.1 Multiple resistance and pH homeostasis protein B [Legionella londiniensis]